MTASRQWGDPAEAMASPRLVAHFLDGRVVKGVSEDFGLSTDSFHLRPLGRKNSIRVPLVELKAVFFVKYFDGRPYYRSARGAHLRSVEGYRRRVEVEFSDGEVVSGWTDGVPEETGSGFFLVPADARSNNKAIFVVRGSALKAVRMHPLAAEPEALPGERAGAPTAAPSEAGAAET